MSPKTHHLDKRAAAILKADTGNDDDELLTPEKVAEWFGISTQWLDIGRGKGYGPKYTTLSPRNIRYKRSDVLRWLKSRTFSSVAESRRKSA
jgi:predicted DNA-binding transcriptional regulator AlpA